MRHLIPANGKYLELIANQYGAERIRRYKRDWRFLWLRWREESDAELSQRLTKVLLSCR